MFGKLEMFNPGGSVKDRIGVAMIQAAEAEGRIEPGRTTIVEATSGNTGIALAFVCAAKGYDLVLTLPQGMSREREGLLRLYGAQVHVTESLGGMNEAVAAAQAMARDPDVFLPDQFSNPANPEAHRRTTGPELWEALDGRIDYLVAGVGTGGTITGAGSFLKERNPQLQVIAVEPATLARAVRRPARPAQDPGHRRGLRPAGARPRRCWTRSSRSTTRTRSRPPAPPRGARACCAGSPAAPRCGPRSRSAGGPRRRASGSPSCCRTRASATCRRRSSRPRPPARRDRRGALARPRLHGRPRAEPGVRVQVSAAGQHVRPARRAGAA